MTETRQSITDALEGTLFALRSQGEENFIHYTRYGGIHVANVDEDGNVEILYEKQKRTLYEKENKVTVRQVKLGVKLRELLDEKGIHYTETPSRDEVVAGLTGVAKNYRRQAEKVESLVNEFSKSCS